MITMLEQNKIKELQDTLTEIINDDMYHILDEDDSRYLAEKLIEQGYRKASEIFEEIEQVINYALCIDITEWEAFAELKKKYTEGE